MPLMQCSIIIANWNGEAFIARAVAAAMQSAQKSGAECELIVYDDASTDKSPQTVAENFPGVRLIRSERNMGFGAACNTAAQYAKGDIILFLNNDLVVKEPFVTRILKPFCAASDVFGVSGRTLEWDGSRPNHTNMSARLHEGKLVLTYDDSAELSPTMFVQGGSCAMKREAFLRLGGFNHLYAPGYWEDYDISYLALKAGMRNLYQPAAEAYHFGQSSMSRAFESIKLQMVKERNRLVFQWVNFTDRDLLKNNLLAIPSAVGRNPAVLTNRIRLRAFAHAVAMTDGIVAERKRRLPLSTRSDESIFREFAGRGKDVV